MVDKLYELSQKGFTVAFEPYFVTGPDMRIKLYRDKQYVVYIISGHDLEYLKEGGYPLAREELIRRVLDELEQKFYHEFGKERHVLHP